MYTWSVNCVLKQTTNKLNLQHAVKKNESLVLQQHCRASHCMSGFKNPACACKSNQNLTWRVLFLLFSVHRLWHLIHKIGIAFVKTHVQCYWKLPITVAVLGTTDDGLYYCFICSSNWWESKFKCGEWWKETPYTCPSLEIIPKEKHLYKKEVT